MAEQYCLELATFMDVVNQSVDYIMEHEITEMVRDAIGVFVQKNVYEAYPNPKAYVRQGEYGGLLDRNNMEATYEKQTKTLTVKNVRDDPDTKDKRWRLTGDPDNTVADVVENGGPYTWRNVRIGPRQFHEPAERFLIDRGYVDSRLTQEMEENLGGFFM